MKRGWIKVCGVTTASDAYVCVDAGADAIGLNLWPQSPRSLTIDMALEVAEAVRGKIEIVAVVVDFEVRDVRRVLERLKPDRVQLHGDESDADVLALQPQAYKAIGLGGSDDLARALRVPGDRVLIDAKDVIARGGTGSAADADLARAVCAARPTVLAGGLSGDNVAAAIAALRPAGVDAASGLERAAGLKIPERVQRYVKEARAAFGALESEVPGV